MGKHDHLISFVPRPDRPDENVKLGDMRKIAWMDGGFMQGAPYFEIMWFCAPREARPPKHTHTFDEFLGFIGSDPDNPSDLNAVIKFQIEDEWYTFTKSVVLFIPAGMAHSPIIIEEVNKPIIHFSGGPNVVYTREE